MHSERKKPAPKNRSYSRQVSGSGQIFPAHINMINKGDRADAIRDYPGLSKSGAHSVLGPGMHGIGRLISFGHNFVFQMVLL